MADITNTDTITVKKEDKYQPIGNKDNPTSFKYMDKEKHLAAASKGGKVCQERKKYNKSFKEALEWALDMPAMRGNVAVDSIRSKYPEVTNRDAMAISAVRAAIIDGNMKGFEAVRDTLGEAPPKKVDVNTDALTIRIETVE